MKKIFIYPIFLSLVSCSIDNDIGKESKINKNEVVEIVQVHSNENYIIGRVQTLDTTCIGSDQPINNENIFLFNFSLNDEGKVKKTELVQSEIVSKADQNCIEALKRSSIDHDFKNFYKIKMPNNLEVVNHFIVADKGTFLNDSQSLKKLDINNDDKPDYVDMCYSSEGVHFNIWDSQQKLKNLFRDYVYLDFETIDNCSEKDYEEK